jgi:hypothetical protein
MKLVFELGASHCHHIALRHARAAAGLGGAQRLECQGEVAVTQLNGARREFFKTLR